MRRTNATIGLFALAYAAFAAIFGRSDEFYFTAAVSFICWAIDWLLCRRPRERDNNALAAMAGFVVLLAYALGASCPAAHADTSSDDWTAQNGWRVCMSLDNYPVLDNVTAIWNDLGSRGFDSKQRAEIIINSVSVGCPRHWPLLKRYVNTYAPQANQNGGWTV